ncbi:MAG: signal recognition particle protein [Lachnospiraceae bacterium]|jgi:signal recognition particle subunit SRP54|nr:signal recognition particle protein [Lachnospiraceae bacterium]
MAFESLTDKLQNIFKALRGKGRLSEADVKAALKEVRMALLEADVNFKVVKQFVNAVQERAVGEDVLGSLTPGQMVVKIVDEELVSLMGSETTELALGPMNEVTVVMMVGLQGAGKTTTAAKLAGKLKSKGRSPLLAACDVYRPAAIKQLEVNGEKAGIPVFSMGDRLSPVDIAKGALAHAKKNGMNVLILDTAGRLHIDEEMMEELAAIKSAVGVRQTVLVVDAMTGQDAVNVAETFQEKIGLDGVILSKMDGDARGGAALSIRCVTDRPILFVGMGEKLSDLEQFYPDRMASRILGMGDVLSLIEKAQQQVDVDQAKALEAKLRKAEFDFNDFLSQMQQIKKMGGMASILGMLPGMGQLAQAGQMDEGMFGKVEAIIYSMTPKERGNPGLINMSRKIRIAKGAGVDINEVNRLVKQFEQMRKMMKQFSGMASGKGRGGLGGLGGLGPLGGLGGLGGGKGGKLGGIKLPF